MAKQIEGINGGFSGRVGTVVGYEWRGRWCMRTYPQHIRDARSERQQGQRARFLATMRLASGLREVLRVGLAYSSKRMHMTESNLFARLNKDCIGIEEGQPHIDYGGLMVSCGTVAEVGFGQPESTVESGRWCIRVPFERNPRKLPVSGSDWVYLAAFCTEAEAGVLSVPAYRRQGEATIELPSDWYGGAIHLYGFAQTYNGEASATAYLGMAGTGGGEEQA